MNFVAVKDYRSAISLALALDQPGRLYNLFKVGPKGVKMTSLDETQLLGLPCAIV